MSNNYKSDDPINLSWVVNQAGNPSVRWGRVAAFVGIVVGSNALAMLLLSLVIGVPFKLALVFEVSCGAIVFLTIAVELQRQRVLTGEWRFRLSISTVLILMIMAACFFAVIGIEIGRAHV